MIGTIDQAALQLRTVARAAYTQESTYSDDDGADLTLAIEDEIIDASNGLATRVVNGLTGDFPHQPLIRWLVGTNARDLIRRADSLGRCLADKRSCRQCQGLCQYLDLASHHMNPSLPFKWKRSQPQCLIKGEVAASSMRRCSTPADSEETELGLGCPQSGSAVTCSGNFLQGRLGFSAGTTRSSKPSPSQAGSYRALRLVFQILGIVGRVSLQGCLQLKGVNSDHLPL
jgi:hypothetical protein